VGAEALELRGEAGELGWFSLGDPTTAPSTGKDAISGKESGSLWSRGTTDRGHKQWWS